MRHALTAILAAAATLIAVGMLGVASAEAPTTTPLQTVGVEGVGKAPITQEANGEAAKAAYRQAMAAAILDGQEKAQFLASHVGGTLGAVQSVVEENGYVECEGGEGRYEQYLGVQPDFGSGRGAPGTAVEAAPEEAKSTPSVRAPTAGKKSKKKKKKAKKATAANCTVTAGVALNYDLD